MPDRFWSTKIKTLIKSFNLKEIKQILDNDEASIYWDAVADLVRQDKDAAVRDASNLAQLINDASDRAIFNRILIQDNSAQVVVKHLLSGKPLELKLTPSQVQSLTTHEDIEATETAKQIDQQKLFWWLWRCLPEAIAKKTGAESLLIPASSNIPDASIWSDRSLAAALAGALVGYKDDDTESRPNLVIFSFSPIQELIKASRKMRDFWAGSWLLHYLSAKICWHLANKYGADSLVYPSLYQQPLIDRWLLDKYPDFKLWIDSPSNRSLLTAGFPNVIVAVLPKSEIGAAMQTARQNLLQEWLKISDLVYNQLKRWGWMPKLQPDDPTWLGWLKAQWQTYWTALPLGKEDLEFTHQNLESSEDFNKWVEAQNKTCNLQENPLFLEEEQEFIYAVKNQIENPGVNVGSWWPYTFDELRFALSSVKNARTWTIPTAFTMRSTISGMGSVVTPNSLNLKTATVSEEQQTQSIGDLYLPGLFDGKEQLNATETLKRGLHSILPELLGLEENRIAASYPDLCSGLAGWLHTRSKEVWQHYNKVCQEIVEDFSWTTQNKNQTKPTALMPWGIPWIDETLDIRGKEKYNPRLLNAGWAIEDYPEADQEAKNAELKRLKEKINSYFSPGNNPTDWYVIAAGDGDGMSEWLKGDKLDNYENYLSSSLIENPPEAIAQSLKNLQKVPKRMGPSTHNALSRALLDFSNRLVPYLTEERYAGRLIYSGGDDVFAYTNLWEWDQWLWDVRQCFRGNNDPQQEFASQGDYWQMGEQQNSSLPKRPLFTMGSKATISFGIVIAPSFRTASDRTTKSLASRRRG